MEPLRPRGRGAQPSASLRPKPNAAKISNACAHLGIPCIDLENFMHQQGWKF
ncbi:DUF4411 family protein [Burkholderia stagnalis]|uniref:DUF4411 family protein n=1 Tax=Burkholderia stagnalis TaxID=1503054 RepID=UPI0009BD6F14|nr:DUF4411 family protein [Burkholderia stagnalis]